MTQQAESAQRSTYDPMQEGSCRELGPMPYESLARGAVSHHQELDPEFMRNALRSVEQIVSHFVPRDTAPQVTRDLFTEVIDNISLDSMTTEQRSALGIGERRALGKKVNAWKKVIDEVYHETQPQRPH